MQFRDDPNSIAPERAIVFEVTGSLPEFYREASRIGLEYLNDDALDIEADGDFFLTKKQAETIPGRIYLAMPNTNALNELVRLWRRYRARKKMIAGFGMWTQLFNMLKDVRAWGPQDRLLPETIEAWRDFLDEAPNEDVRFEVELWYRTNARTRLQSFDAFAASVNSMGGRIVDKATIPEIRYDAALIDLPAPRIRELIAEPTIMIARLDEIMFIRPQSMVKVPVGRNPNLGQVQPSTGAPPERPPIAALLDGLPVQNHQQLAGRLEIDDPDGLEPLYDPRARAHGTQMASLILHGDLNAQAAPLSRRLHVRPVLRPVQGLNGWVEQTPNDRLLVDHIHSAVRRMKEGWGSEPPTAPNVFLVNISLGDPNRRFAGPISPWARLLDYLANRYRVLFLVSAGNVTEPLPLPKFSGWTDFAQAAKGDRERELFQAVDKQKAVRTLLSPAEAINVLTVGAAHRDSVAPVATAAMSMDAIHTEGLPNVSSALGLGFRKVIKPDFLVEGGREHTVFRATNPHLHVQPSVTPGRAYGLLAAAPDPVGGSTTRALHTAGTSVATAMATRAGHLVFDALTDRAGGAMTADLPPDFHALVVKALLVHGTKWGAGAKVIESFSGSAHYAKKDNVSRFVGHGFLDTSRIVACTAERATLIGYGTIDPDTACLYRIPLPPSLNGVKESRSVTVTLAWFTPINPRHQGYRMAALEAKPGGDPGMSLGVSRSKLQPHDKAVDRGTVFHDRREGDRAAPYVDKGNLVLRVSARETAGTLEEPVRYAIAVSIEVAVGSAIRVYDEVRTAVTARVRPSVTP